MVVVGVILLLGACRKNDGITISGIVARDESGNLVPANGTDASDWGYKDAVPDNILNLLKGLPTGWMRATATVVDPSNPTGQVSTIAYPNPCHNGFVLDAMAYDTTVGFAYAIVDADLNIKSSGAFNGMSTISTSVLDNGYYRVYYAYVDSQRNVIYKGYGDIKKQ